MNSLERTELYYKIKDYLDNIEEIIEDSDASDDEECVEILDLVEQIRIIVNKE